MGNYHLVNDPYHCSVAETKAAYLCWSLLAGHWAHSLSRSWLVTLAKPRGSPAGLHPIVRFTECYTSLSSTAEVPTTEGGLLMIAVVPANVGVMHAARHPHDVTMLMYPTVCCTVNASMQEAVLR